MTASSSCWRNSPLGRLLASWTRSVGSRTRPISSTSPPTSSTSPSSVVRRPSRPSRSTTVVYSLSRVCTDRSRRPTSRMRSCARLVRRWISSRGSTSSSSRCAPSRRSSAEGITARRNSRSSARLARRRTGIRPSLRPSRRSYAKLSISSREIGRASCRERV